MSTENKTVQISCPACGKTLNVKRELLGRRAKCPGCGDSISLLEAAAPLPASKPVAPLPASKPVAQQPSEPPVIGSAKPTPVAPVPQAAPASNEPPVISGSAAQPAVVSPTPVGPVVDSGASVGPIVDTGGSAYGGSTAQAAPGGFPVTDSSSSATSRVGQRRKKKMDNSTIIYMCLAIVAVLATFLFKFMDKADASNESRQAMYDRYEINFTSASKQRIKQLVDRYHDQCFSKSFTIGGRRQSNKFDIKKYAIMMDELIVPQLSGGY